MKRNPNYWDKESYSGKHSSNFNQIRFIFYTEQSILAEKLKKGDIDLYQVGVARKWHQDFTAEEVDAIAKNHIVRQRVYNNMPNGIGGWAFNLREEPFNDIRIRKAIRYLINREKMMSRLFFNEYKYKDSFFPNSPYENPDNEKIRFDPDQAIMLLEEAGWYQDSLNDEGYLVKDGEVFELDLSMVGDDARVETILQEDFRAVGIKLNLKQVTWATFMKEGNERLFKIKSQNWSGGVFPSPYYMFHSKFADPNNTNNIFGVKDPKIDELTEAELYEFDINKRIEILRELDKHMSDMHLIAFNWYADNLRLLYWNKFGTPEFVLGKFQRSAEDAAMAYWWYDVEQAYKLDKAKVTGEKLKPRPAEVRYWEKRAEK
ncbi:MAG: ABC transporter substrate-binding protein, partial [Candidatus Muiribacteriaceae bacterium]